MIARPDDMIYASGINILEVLGIMAALDRLENNVIKLREEKDATII